MKATNRGRSKMNRKTAAIISLSLVLVLTVAVGILSLTGMKLDSRGLYRLLPWVPSPGNWPESISLGLDLKGGVYVEYEATLSPEQQAEGADYAALMESTQQVMVQRLTDKGFAEATVTQIGNTGIRVEIPDVKDPQAVLDLIGTPAKLEFADPDGNIFMDGSYVQTASQGYDQENKPCIQLELTKQGEQLFGDMTAKCIGQQIAIYLDGELLMSPTVETAIYGSVQITGNYTVETAADMAMQLQSGALPMDLRQDKLDTISATLGQDALDTSVTAAMIGIALVMLIMIVRYRSCGVLASWALTVYIIALFFLIAIIPGIQLTLPGIAGVVLGIGMAVDANVVIFERIKEEIRGGRPLIHAVRIGFKNAMTAILDANVTTIIAAVVLLIFGTGSVRGFATTLLLGVLLSMVTAIVVSRFLLTNACRLIKNPAVFLCAPDAQPEKEVQ
ncbi:MAG: protein translocase subunit SecD [Clostridia bacterium]|nr:protein translocase subunit SecD [Clostridia bacterium]